MTASAEVYLWRPSKVGVGEYRSLEGMSATVPFKRLILRAVLRDVSPIVARVISVGDDIELSDL
jgi:hypothetical protein